MSHVKQVANLLGVELGEEFVLDHRDSAKYRFAEKWVLEFTVGGGQWYPCNLERLGFILNGTNKICKIPFQPRFGGKYYTYLFGWDSAHMVTWEDSIDDYIRKEAGVVFRTEEEAKQSRPEIYKKLTGKEWSFDKGDES